MRSPSQQYNVLPNIIVLLLILVLHCVPVIVVTLQYWLPHCFLVYLAMALDCVLQLCRYICLDVVQMH